MTRWFHDLISSLLSARWMFESKSAPQITWECSRTRKKSATVLDPIAHSVFSHCGKWMRFLFKYIGFRSHCPHAPPGSSALQSQSLPASIASCTRIPPRIARNARSHHPDSTRRETLAIRVSRLDFYFSGRLAAPDARNLFRRPSFSQICTSIRRHMRRDCKYFEFLIFSVIWIYRIWRGCQTATARDLKSRGEIKFFYCGGQFCVVWTSPSETVGTQSEKGIFFFGMCREAR